jgi:hypothetical protein
MTMSMSGLLTAIGLSVACVVAAGCSGESGDEGAQSSEALMNNGSGPEGSACSCTDSQGNSHSGTFTNDVDGLNCAGSWGSVACTDSSGKDNGKCRAAMRHLPLPPISAPPVRYLAP